MAPPLAQPRYPRNPHAGQGTCATITAMADIYYDIETRELVDTTNPDRNAAVRALHFSVGASWCECHRDMIFHYPDLLTAHLLAHERIIGFNILQFDNLVLANSPERTLPDGGEPAGRPNERPLPDSPDELKTLLDSKSLDLARDLQMRLGYQVSLAALAAGSLSKEKKGTGPLAVVWWRMAQRLRRQYAYALREVGDAEGAERMVELGSYFQEKLERYCAGDVQLLRQLFEYATANRRVAFVDLDGERRVVKVDWR